MKRQLFFLDSDGTNPLILVFKKDKIYIVTENEELESLEPEKLLTAVFWELLDQNIVLIGDL